MVILGGVRFDPDDLPRFAGDLAARAFGGASVPTVDDAAFVHAVELLAGSGGGAVDPDEFDPAELLAYVLALVIAETSLPAAALREPVGLDVRRGRVEDAVRRVVGHRA
ncbi:hypothetical protein ITJ54_10565 [Curtobacterium sp. VKM Ac-2865]|uniref:hypothetical protein n=1 Tax=Curtobacterium sp. VKM Ac-2865 TaxID=2783817 RepID=UPI00188D1CBE|nr:hypothetical protein [Curtobacterium sp. VKM Ac-2865]MBF4583111.1 hypothetical protein [Curtobacterium sp. VKM Ac-2865]